MSSDISENTSLYAVVYYEIKKKIELGEYVSGQKLPTERELANMFGVSLITIRRAIQELTDEGFIIKVQGRGTFVEHQKLQRCIDRDFQILGFTTTCQLNGVKASTQILNRGIAGANSKVSRALGVDIKSPTIYLERVCLADNVPIMLEKGWFLPEFDFMKDEELENSSIIKTLASHGVYIDLASDNIIEVGRADAIVSRSLKLGKGEPIFIISSVLNDKSGRKIYLSVEYIAGNRFRLKL